LKIAQSFEDEKTCDIEIDSGADGHTKTIFEEQMQGPKKDEDESQDESSLKQRPYMSLVQHWKSEPKHQAVVKTGKRKKWSKFCIIL